MTGVGCASNISGHEIAEEKDVSVALITGGSAGLGRGLTLALADRGWTVVTDGRSADRLARLPGERVVTVTGDINVFDHRARLVEEVERLGRLDLLVHNASTLGPLPLRPLLHVSAADHLTLTLAAEEGLLGYAVDPGDMRTQMQADAFPGEDISDRPLPETVVPKLLTLLRDRPPSGRYRAADLESGDLQPVTAGRLT